MTLTEYLKREDEDDPSLYEDEMDYGEEIFVDGNLVYLDGRKFVSETDNITDRTGVWCEQDENGEWAPDWSITLLHANDKGPKDYLYFENGSIQSALHPVCTAQLFYPRRMASEYRSFCGSFCEGRGWKGLINPV